MPKSVLLFLIGLFGLSVVFCWPMIVAQEKPPTKENAADGDFLNSGDTATADIVRGSWPRFLGNDFRNAAEVDGIDWAAKPDLAWAKAVGDGYGLGPIDRGFYFHFDAVQSGTKERLQCIDMTDGQTTWSKLSDLDYKDLYGYETGPRSSPTIAGDLIYTMGVAGRLTCRKIENGDEVWSVETNDKYDVVQNFFGVAGAPLVLDNQVIVMVGGSPPEDQEIAPGQINRVSANGSLLVAFDRMTGNELWKAGDDLASYSSPRTMQIDGETLVLIYARDHLMAIDPKSATVRWKLHHRAEVLESVNAMVPIVDGDKVFVSECYQVGSELLKATANDFEVVWQDPDRQRRRQAMRVHWSNPALIDGHLYGGSGRNAPDSDFRCVEFATGKVKWVDPRSTRTAVTQAGGHLVVIEERGFAQVLKPNVKKMEVAAEWNLQLPDGKRPALTYPCWASPVIVGDRVLVRGNENVVCLKLKKR